jgi:hypothetical protein
MVKTKPQPSNDSGVALSFIRYCMAFFLFLPALSVQAQAGFTFTDANWATTFGFPGANENVLGFPGANGNISALAADANGHVYVAGNFNAIGSAYATNIAAWNGSSWSPLGLGLTGMNEFSMATADCMAIDSSGDLYVGGTAPIGPAWAQVSRAKSMRSFWTNLATFTPAAQFPRRAVSLSATSLNGQALIGLLLIRD